LLKGQALSTVMVERVKPEVVLPGGALDRQALAVKDAVPSLKETAGQAGKHMPRWSYTLLSNMAKPASDAKGAP
jgi:hypothetical protein